MKFFTCTALAMSLIAPLSAQADLADSMVDLGKHAITEAGKAYANSQSSIKFSRVYQENDVEISEESVLVGSAGIVNKAHSLDFTDVTQRNEIKVTGHSKVFGSIGITNGETLL